jgi:hypothetical protein
MAAGQLDITRAITVKGGWDATFATWDPDANPTYFTGTLALNNDGAVWGGFRMISHPASGQLGLHNFYAGTFIRNYVEIAYTDMADGASNFTAMTANTCAGHTLSMLCNDIYVVATKNSPGGIIHFNDATALSINLGNGSPLEISQTRMCFEGATSTGTFQALQAVGANLAETASLTLANDFIEVVPLMGAANTPARIYSNGGTLNITVVNNTLSGPLALAGYNGASTGKVSWSLANNILFCPTTFPKAMDLTFSGGGGVVEVSRSQSNLIFGYTNNTVMPSPAAGSGDTIGGATVGSTFTANYHPSPGGPAAGTGANLFNDPNWANVTVDLDNKARGFVGPWDRGAYQQ